MIFFLNNISWGPLQFTMRAPGPATDVKSPQSTETFSYPPIQRPRTLPRNSTFLHISSASRSFSPLTLLHRSLLLLKPPSKSFRKIPVFRRVCARFRILRIEIFQKASVWIFSAFCASSIEFLLVLRCSQLFDSMF